ncbi:unnamed protein product [Effrenium voratum]|nr:unnamed protein product [Effrenium voratum]
MRRPELPDPSKQRFWAGVTDAQATEIAGRAHTAATTLWAISKAGATAASVARELSSWYRDIGKSLLFGFQLSDTNDDSDDAEESDMEVDPPPACEEPVISSLSQLAVEAKLKKDICDLQCAGPPVSSLLADDAKGSAESNAAAASATSASATAMMLHQCGFLGWVPPADDTKDKALTRVAALLPSMMKAVSDVRLAEGFLSPPQVLSSQRPMNEMNLRSDLCKAQKVFDLVGGGRQSRFTDWQTYSRLVAKSAQDLAAPLVQKGSSNISQEIVEFTPRSVLRDGKRSYQVLAVTEKVWRGSMPRRGRKATSTSSSKVYPGPFKAELATFVHLCLLEHRHECMCKATAESHALLVDPRNTEADDVTILFEVPRSQLVYHEADGYLLVENSSAARDALRQVAGEAVGQPKLEPTVYTKFSFPATKGGRDSMAAYMEVMRALREKVEGKPLLTKKGCVRGIKGDTQWQELKLRVPTRFAARAGFACKPLTQDQQSSAVWTKFKEIAPTVVSGSKGFRAFLAQLGAQSSDALPTVMDIV